MLNVAQCLKVPIMDVWVYYCARWRVAKQSVVVCSECFESITGQSLYSVDSKADRNHTVSTVNMATVLVKVFVCVDNIDLGLLDSVITLTVCETVMEELVPKLTRTKAVCVAERGRGVGNAAYNSIHSLCALS